MKKPTERFSETVQDYLQYRPSYPPEVLQVLIAECDLTKDTVIADVGSGTGFLAKLFLAHGNTVYGVEPNKEMRLAAESYLAAYPNFHSVDGAAEVTTLLNNSIDFITVGTAFHWFDAEKTKHEFKRILKPSGWVLLIWNVRNMQQSKLLQDYEKMLLTYCADYKQERAQQFDVAVLEKFFNPYVMQTKSFINRQQFNWNGLKGRLLSTSYTLRASDDHYEEMLDELKLIFDRHQQNGIVDFLYDTKLYYGKLNDC
jgi:ubiquinone/menaquinone biosynthesis C-methylase UbiE